MNVPTSTARRAPIARTMVSMSTAWSSPICMTAAPPVFSAVTAWRSRWTSSGPVECSAAYSSIAASVNRERRLEAMDGSQSFARSLRRRIPAPHDGSLSARRDTRLADARCRGRSLVPRCSYGGRVNRLGTETSPYLRQHADNPVDWYPWGEDAFARARAEDKPVLLSVGYSSCHWCHVMAHESFEDADDRRGHERAVRERQGRPRGAARRRRHLHAGGTGDDRPRRLADDGVPRPRRAGPSSAVRTSRSPTARACPASCGSWTRSTTRGANGAASCSSRRATLHEAIARERAHPGRCGRRAVGRGAARSGRRGRTRSSTLGFGGFGRAPKFPQAMTLTFLLGAGGARPAAGDAARPITVHARRDGRGRHVRPGGRRVPPLLGRRVLARAALREDALRPGAARTRVPARVAGRRAAAVPARSSRRPIEYVLRDLRHADGGFFSAEDADSEGVEGKFYLWSLAEIEAIAGDDTAEVVALLRRDRRRELRGPAHRRTAATSCTSSTARRIRPSRYTRCSRASCAARSHTRPARPRRQGPAGWNALFLRALAEAAFVLERDDWMDAARRERGVPAAASCGATTAGCCGRGRAGARTSSRTPRTTPRSSRRCSRWPRSTTSRGSPRRARVADDLVRLFADDDRRRRSSPPAPTPSRSSCARRTTRTTRPRPRTRSPPHGLLRLAALTGDDGLREARGAVDRVAGARARRTPDRVRIPARRVRAPRHAADSRLRWSVRSTTPERVALRRRDPSATAPRVGARRRTTRMPATVSRRCSPTAAPSTARRHTSASASRAADRRPTPQSSAPSSTPPSPRALSPTHAFWRQA